MRKRILTYIVLVICILGLITLPLDLFAQDNNAPAEQQSWPNTIIQLENALASNPNDAQIRDSLANAYNNYGLTFANQKQWLQAEAYLQKALNLLPNSDGIRHNLSNIYYAHGFELYTNDAKQTYNSNDHQESKNLANKAIAIYPKNVNAYLLLGDIEYMNQSMDEAKNAWQTAANLMPENQQIQIRLAKITREAQTESKMNMRYNPYFIIKIDSNLDQVPGFDINQALDAARMAVTADFKYTQNRKIPVIVYTREQYQETLTDAPDWSDGAFDGKLRIILSKNPKYLRQVNSTIVHEYTHAVIADLTNNKCPRWLNEGIARYEEYKHGVQPVISTLGLAYNTNNLLMWDKIDEAFLSSNKSEVLLAYDQSFSFVQYVVEAYGMSRLVTLLNTLGSNVNLSDAVYKVYNMPLETLQRNWREWLNNYIKEWSERPATIIY